MEKRKKILLIVGAIDLFLIFASLIAFFSYPDFDGMVKDLGIFGGFYRYMGRENGFLATIIMLLTLFFVIAGIMYLFDLWDAKIKEKQRETNNTVGYKEELKRRRNRLLIGLAVAVTVLLIIVIPFMSSLVYKVASRHGEAFEAFFWYLEQDGNTFVAALTVMELIFVPFLIIYGITYFIDKRDFENNEKKGSISRSPFCPKCGAILPIDVNFCGICGFKIDE